MKKKLMWLMIVGAVLSAGWTLEGAESGAVTNQHQIIGIKTKDQKTFERNTHADAGWFANAGLGIFIHWGLSSVDGRVDLSWGMMTNTPWDRGTFKLTPNQYFAMASQFNPDRYDPDKWLEAAARAGMKYAVMTTKHHEGYALWPSKYGSFSTRTHMQSRDLVRPYVEACRKHGLKVGLYYSPPDWYYNRQRMSFSFERRGDDSFPDLGLDHQPVKIQPLSEREQTAWQEGFKAYLRGQIEELLTRYGKIDLLWFDGGPEAISFERLRELQPGIVVNPRMHGYGDFETAEVEFSKQRKSGWWEMCSIWAVGPWGYLKNEQYKSTAWMLEEFSRVRSWGGNYLINVGPRPNGELPEVVYQRLDELGRWMKTNVGAVLDTTGYGWPEDANVPVTRKKETFHLFVAPGFKDPVRVKLPGTPEKVWLTSDRKELDYQMENGRLVVSVPSSRRDRDMSVVVVEIRP